MSKVRQILRQHSQGVGSRSIEKQSDVARNTVKKYIALFKSLKMTFEDLDKLNDQDLDELFNQRNKVLNEPLRVKQLEAFFGTMESKLRKTGITRHILWEQYIGKHIDGYQYTQFCKRFKDWARRYNPTMHIIHKAGDKLFVDYAGKKLEYVDRDSGEVFKAEVFVAILGCSQLTYMEASATQQKEDFVGSLERSLHYYGGVPAAIIPDNLKSAVTKPSRYEPTLNQCFEEFAEHYSTTAIPARIFKPKDKALVEGAVKILYTRIYTRLQNRHFYSIGELNKAIWELLEEQHNAVNFQGKRYSRRDLFKEVEQGELNDLPRHRFQMKKYAQVTVMKNGHVHLSADKHYYSVPFEYIGKKVRLAYSQNSIEVFCKFTRIATHQRTKSPYNYTTAKEHMASTHLFVSEWNPQKFIAGAAQIGPDVELFIRRILDKKQHPEQAYKMCMGVLNYGKRVGHQRLINACRRALGYETYNFKIIEKILEKGLDKMDEGDPEQTPDMPAHANIRGKQYYN